MLAHRPMASKPVRLPLERDPAALPYVEQAIALATETGNALLLGRCELLHARVLDALGRREPAETALAAARQALARAEGAQPWQAELDVYAASARGGPTPLRDGPGPARPADGPTRPPREPGDRSRGLDAA
jgi:hypothetical protein